MSQHNVRIRSDLIDSVSYRTGSGNSQISTRVSQHIYPSYEIKGISRHRALWGTLHRRLYASTQWTVCTGSTPPSRLCPTNKVVGMQMVVQGLLCLCWLVLLPFLSQALNARRGVGLTDISFYNADGIPSSISAFCVWKVGNFPHLSGRWHEFILQTQEYGEQGFHRALLSWVTSL